MSSPLLIASAVASSVVIGFVPALVDSIRAPLHQQHKGSEPRVDRILALFYLAWLPAMPLSGWLIDRWGNGKEILFLGLLGCVLGVAWLGLSQALRSLASSVLVLGAGYACVATAGIRLMPAILGFTAETSMVAGLNVGFVFVSLGAVAAPWVVARFVQRWGYRQGLLYLSLTLVVAAALVFLVWRDELAAPAASLSWRDLVGNVRLWLLGATLILYFALENCLDVWPEPYLKELGYQARTLTGRCCCSGRYSP